MNVSTLRCARCKTALRRPDADACESCGAPIGRREDASAAQDGSGAALSRTWRILIPALLFAASLASFWPCIHQGFVALDDDANFELNYLFRGLGQEQLSWIFGWKSYHYGHWHPLTWFTFGLDYALYGLDGAAYHRTNLAIHALSVLAFYAVALELLRWIVRWVSADAASVALDRSRELALHACAALAAVSWGLHPLRVESVAWATERRDLLSALFLALATWSYLRSARFEAARVPWLAATLAFYALSLLSKAWGMTFPVLLLALDVYPLRRVRVAGWNRLLVEKLLLVPFAVVTALQAIAAQRQISAAVTLGEHGVLKRAAQAAYGLCFYVWKTLWPTDLSCHYLLEVDFHWDRPIHLATMAAVVAVTVALALLARRFPAGLATWFCYGVLVSPVLGLFQSGAQKVADRYAHLSSMPFSILLAGCALVLLARRDPAERRARGAWVALGATALLALVLGFASNRQTRVWKDSETLFRRASEVEPDNYFVLHNLTVSLYRRQAYAEALEIEKRSVAAHPGKGNEEARYTLGLLYSNLGRPQEAEQTWREALEVAPDHANSWNSLEPRLRARGEIDELIALYEKSLAKKPDFAGGYDKLEALYRERGQSAKVLEMWQRAEASGRVPRAKVEAGLARALTATGRVQEAEKHAFRAAAADKANQAVLDELARLALKRGDTAALELWERARREYVPASVVENGLGKTLMQLARFGEAEPHLFAAQSLDNRNEDYVVDLCELFERTGRRSDAETNLRMVLQRNPAHPRAQALLRKLQGPPGG